MKKKTSTRGRKPAVQEGEERARINAIVSVEQAGKYRRLGASKWLRASINRAKDKQP